VCSVTWLCAVSKRIQAWLMDPSYCRAPAFGAERAPALAATVTAPSAPCGLLPKWMPRAA
jgi:hypothetical protein